MMQFFKVIGNIWKFVSNFIVPILAVIIAYLSYIASDKAKTISLEYDKEIILAQKLKTNDEITVLYNQSIVKNVKSLRLKVNNSGKVPIVSEDIRDTVKVLFPDSVRILSASPVTLVKKSSIKLSSKNTISVEFDLLNPGESLLFDVVYSAERDISPVPVIQGLIVGGNVEIKVNEGTEPFNLIFNFIKSNSLKWIFGYSGLFMLFMFIFSIYSLIGTFKNQNEARLKTTDILAIIVVIIFIIFPFLFLSAVSIALAFD